MINDKGIHDLIKHTKNMLNDYYISDELGYDAGQAYYTKDDLAVIYKMYRLFQLNLINQEELFNLIKLYHEYIELSDLFVDEQTDKRLCEIEKQLNDLELLPHYLDPNYLIDSTINKEEFKLKLKNKRD